MKRQKLMYFAQLSRIAAAQSHCMRRKVGAVLLDANLKIRSVAYNGPPPGFPHCDEGHPCEGLDAEPGKDKCIGNHAEQNAVLDAKNAQDLKYIVVTEAPCLACTKFLLQTSVDYICVPHNADKQPDSKKLWLTAGKTWVSF